MATLLLRRQACPLLRHCPCVGPSVAQTLHLATLAGPGRQHRRLPLTPMPPASGAELLEIVLLAALYRAV